MTSSQSPAENATRPAAPGALESLGVALGRIPSGLFVVTWRAGDSDRGMLASWVMQAGFSPPMLTIAVASGRDLLAAVEAGVPFVVNVLAETQRSLLARFGKPAVEGEDPFAGLAVSRAGCAAAMLDDAAAWLECQPVSRTSGTESLQSDHAVILAHVTNAGAASDKPPLVHVRKNGLRY